MAGDAKLPFEVWLHTWCAVVRPVGCTLVLSNSLKRLWRQWRGLGQYSTAHNQQPFASSLTQI